MLITGGETTVIGAVAGAPFPKFEVTALVVLRKAPGLVPAVTVTLNVQVPPPAIVAPVSVMVVDVADSVPPHCDVAAIGVTVTPGGVSVKPTPVKGVLAFGLRMLKVNVEVPPTATEAGLKIFVVTGSPTTVSVADAGGVVPTLEVTELVVLTKVPTVVPVTVTLNVQVPRPATVAPLSVMVVDVADSVPPQTDVPAMGVTITSGGVSVKPTPVRAVVAFGLVMVKFNVEVAPAPTVDGEKDFVTVGPSATV